MNLFETFSKPEMAETAKEFPLGIDAFITLLPTNGEKSKRAFQKMMEPFAPRLKANHPLTENEVKDLNIRHFADTIIVNWRGLKGEKDEEITYSKENAKLLLTNPKLEGFFDLIARMAQNDAAFSEEQAQEDEGNS